MRILRPALLPSGYHKPRGHKPKYPLRTLKIGGDFFIKCPVADTEKRRLNVLNAINHMRKWYPGKHGKWRFVTEKESGGLRVRRVKNA